MKKRCNFECVKTGINDVSFCLFFRLCSWCF